MQRKFLDWTHLMIQLFSVERYLRDDQNENGDAKS